MRTICAPSYANIIMPDFEEKHICSLIKNKSIMYLHRQHWCGKGSTLKVNRNNELNKSPSTKNQLTVKTISMLYW